MTQESANLLVSVIGFALLFWLLARLRPALNLDILRQDLFDQRHNLLVYAHSRSIPFDHPAYCMLRSTINGHIRFAERLDFLRMYFLTYYLRRDREQFEQSASETYSEELTRKVADLSDEDAAQFRKMADAVTESCVRHALHSHLLPCLLMAALTHFRVTQRVGARLKERYFSRDRLARHGLAQGDILIGGGIRA